MAYKVNGLEHVGINCPTEKVDAVKDFYIKYFGFKTKTDVEGKGVRMVILRREGCMIEIVNEQPESDKPYSIDHLCFNVSGLHEMLEDLEKDGIKIDEGKTDFFNEDGIHLFSIKFITGLVGERIELYEKLRPDLYEHNGDE